MALLRCFFPMYPLGHRVSEISSTGITNCSQENAEKVLIDDCRRIAVATIRDALENNMVLRKSPV